MKFKSVGNDEFPVETEKDLWIYSNNLVSLAEIIEKVQEKWPNISLDKIQIEAYNHHQYATTYDIYESSDYVNYIYISLEE